MQATVLSDRDAHQNASCSCAWLLSQQDEPSQSDRRGWFGQPALCKRLEQFQIESVLEDRQVQASHMALISAILVRSPCPSPKDVTGPEDQQLLTK
jgi:hypothetical protein